MVTIDLPGDVKVEDAKPEDIVHALAQPRDEDWYLILSRGDGNEFIEASVSDGALELVCEVGDEYLETQSHIDEDTVKAIMADFAAGGSAWRDRALWAKPKPAAKPASVAEHARANPPVIFVIAFIGLLVVAGLVGGSAALFTVFALAFPGIIALATVVKTREVKRAAAWSKASARIVRSELAPRTINEKEVLVPAVEYEFTVGMNFAKMRGNRITFAEVEGPHGAQETLAKYRVGTTATVYYNPDNPRESVLDRELAPKLVYAAWGTVAVLTLLILGGGYWWGFR